MSSLTVPVVSKDQQKAFEPFVIDVPVNAPQARLPFHIFSALNNLNAVDATTATTSKPVKWRVGHVEPLGWFILHENGAPVFIENQLAIPEFWRLWQNDQLVKTPEMEELDKRVKEMQAGIDPEHLQREAEKHTKDLAREQFRVGQPSIPGNPVPDAYGVVQPDAKGNHFNQQKPAGLSSGATPDPANPHIEGDKAASTSSVSSDSTGLPGNKTIQPHGAPDAVAPLRSDSLTMDKSLPQGETPQTNTGSPKTVDGQLEGVPSPTDSKPQGSPDGASKPVAFPGAPSDDYRK